MSQPATLAEAFRDICAMDGTLNAKLAAYSDKLRELSFPFAEAYDDLVARLYAGEVGEQAPAVGDPMPGFLLPALDGSIVGLEDLIAKGPVVINLNRGHWCPFCKIQLRALADCHAFFAARGARVVSIMPDRQQFLDDLHAFTDAKIDILTDVDNGYSLSLGLVMWLGDRIRTLMDGRGIHLDTIQGSEGWFVPVPATFVVGRDQRVAARFVDADFRKRMEIQAILDAVSAADTRRR